MAASSTTWPIDRACAIVLSSVRRYASSIARIIAPGIVRAGIAGAITSSMIRRRSRRPAEDAGVPARQVHAAEDGDPAGDDGEHAAEYPARHRLRGRLGEPALGHRVLLQLLVEPGHVLAQLRHVLGLHESVVGEREEPGARYSWVAASSGRRRARSRWAMSTGSPGSRHAREHADLLATEAEQAGLVLAERDVAAAREVEHRRRQRVAGRLARPDQRTRRRREAGRRGAGCGSTDRRGRRVAAVAEPRPAPTRRARTARPARRRARGPRRAGGLR